MAILLCRWLKRMFLIDLDLGSMNIDRKRKQIVDKFSSLLHFRRRLNKQFRLCNPEEMMYSSYLVYKSDQFIRFLWKMLLPIVMWLSDKLKRVRFRRLFMAYPKLENIRFLLNFNTHRRLQLDMIFSSIKSIALISHNASFFFGSKISQSYETSFI